MPKGYHHLTYEKRCQLYTLKDRGCSISEIAKFLEVHRSTLYDELARNTGQKGYRYKQAQEKATERRSSTTNGNFKMTPEVVRIIEEKLKFKWSPEQISGWLEKEKGTQVVSHETIYKYVWNDKRRGGVIYKDLRHQGKKYNKRGSKNSGRGCIPDRIDISQRPSIVDEKSRIGDWEFDTIIGREHKGAIVSMVERFSKYTMLVKVNHKTSEEVEVALTKRLSQQRGCVFTGTSDNGKEFANHKQVSKCLGIDFYFARPYHSWERGLNEHTNGLFRQYVPKNAYFENVSHEDICMIENALNDRPRKILKFFTPREILDQHKKTLININL